MQPGVETVIRGSPQRPRRPVEETVWRQRDDGVVMTWWCDGGERQRRRRDDGRQRRQRQPPARRRLPLVMRMELRRFSSPR